MDFYTYEGVLKILNSPEMKPVNRYRDFLKDLGYISRLYHSPNEFNFAKFRVYTYNKYQIDNWKLNILSGRRTEYNPKTKSRSSIIKLKYCLFYRASKSDHLGHIDDLFYHLNKDPLKHKIKLENFREDYPEFFI